MPYSGTGHSKAENDNHSNQMNPNNDAYWSSRAGLGGGSYEDSEEGFAPASAITNALNALAAGDEDEQEEWLQTLLNFNTPNQKNMFIELKKGTAFFNSSNNRFEPIDENLRLNLNRFGMYKFGDRDSASFGRGPDTEKKPMKVVVIQLEGRLDGSINMGKRNYTGTWFEIGFPPDQEAEFQRVKRILDDLTLK